MRTIEEIKADIEYLKEDDLDDTAIMDCMKELLNYREAERDGRLVVLPCKETFKKSGDYVYLIFDGEISEVMHCGLEIDNDGKFCIDLAADEKIFPYRLPNAEYDTDPTDWCINITRVSPNDFGKTVFLTKQEAEQALKERIENI